MAFGLFFFAYYFISNDQHLSETVPDTSIEICDSQCWPTPPDLDAFGVAARTKSYCTSPDYVYNSTEGYFSNIVCVERCQGLSGALSCMHPSEFIYNSGDSAFIPTFYQERYDVPYDGVSCPQGFVQDSSYSVCTRTNDFFVAGVEELSIIYKHEFTVEQKVQYVDLFLDMEPLKSRSGAFHSQGWENGLKTILFAYNSGKYVEKRSFTATNTIDLSLQELLESAFYDDADGPLSLDSRYVRLDRGIVNDGNGGPPLRLTGVEITIDIFITDLGTCLVYDQLRLQDSFNEVAKVEVDNGGGPVACLFIHADRTWTTKTESQYVYGMQGARRDRTMYGAHIKFRKMGKFAFFNPQAIITGITIFFLWMQVPLVLATWFTSTVLGQLSNIYGRVLFQELNLTTACKGLAARLVAHSASFMDLYDKAPSSTEGGDATKDVGMSKKRILQRFRDFLETSESIDDRELQNFVDFLHDGLKQLKVQGDNEPADFDPKDEDTLITLQDFCTACASNEPLKFESLVRLFDKDRTLGFIEAFFLDSDIKSLHAAAKQDLRASSVELAESESMEVRYSRVEHSMSDVQKTIHQVTELETRSYEAAKALDPPPEVMFLFTDPKKLRTSVCSSGRRTIKKANSSDPKKEDSKTSCAIPDEDGS